MSNKRLKVSHTSGSEEVSPTSISDLPNDALKHCFSFIPGSYITVAPVSRQFHSNYCTRGMDDSSTTLSTDSILKIGQNRRTTVDAVSDDIKLTEYAFIKNAPEKFMMKVCQRAAMKGHIDVIECAIAFGVDFIQRVRKYPEFMTILAEEGNLEMIKYFDDKLPEGFEIKYSYSNEFIWKDIFYRAALSNHLHIMKWIYEEKIQNADLRTDMKSGIEAHEYVLEGIVAPRVTEELCIKAAMHGNIQVLEYCHRNNFRFEDRLCNVSMKNKDKDQALVTLMWLRQHGSTWNENLCRAAAINDNLEALKWARSEGCPWDEGTLEEAAQRGNIPMIEYCLQNRCPMTADVCMCATGNKDHDTAFEVLKLLRKHSCPWDWRTGNNMMSFGSFEAMWWAIRNGYPWTIYSIASLVLRGNVETIEEILQKNQQHGSILFVQTEGIVKMAPDVARAIDSELFRRPPNNNDSLIIEKLKLLRKYGYEWNTQTSATAAKYGRLRLLQWLYYMKCPMDESSCAGAVYSINIEILKYAHEVAGCGLSKEAYAYCFHHRRGTCSGLKQTHTEILEYLKKNDCPRPEDGDDLDSLLMVQAF